MTPGDAKGLTREEIDGVLKHALEKEKDEWRRMRWLATVIMNIEGKSVKKVVKETDLFRFEEEKTKSSLRALLESHG